LLGKKLVTIQTGPAGSEVRQVLVEQGCQIARELYLGIVVDRAACKPVLMVSNEGGVEIEKVAAETPEKIFKEHFDPQRGFGQFPSSQAVQETQHYRPGRSKRRVVYEDAVQVLCGLRLLIGRSQPIGDNG
jgi:succinyl-CoA synthetase beta subunit